MCTRTFSFCLVGFFGGGWLGESNVDSKLYVGSFRLLEFLGQLRRSKMVVNENDCIVAWLMSDTLLHLIKAFYNTG